MAQDSRKKNPWADEELPIRQPGHPHRATLLTIVALAVTVGLLGGTLVTFLALRDPGDAGPATQSTSSSVSTTSRSSNPRTTLTPSDNQAGGELTHLPVNSLPDVRTRASDDPVKVTFVNRSSRPVQVQWVDTEGGLVPYSQLAAGQTVEQGTFATHPWAVTDAAGDALVLVIAGKQPGTVTVTD